MVVYKIWCWCKNTDWFEKYYCSRSLLRLLGCGTHNVFLDAIVYVGSLVLTLQCFQSKVMSTYHMANYLITQVYTNRADSDDTPQ